MNYENKICQSVLWKTKQNEPEWLEKFFWFSEFEIKNFKNESCSKSIKERRHFSKSWQKRIVLQGKITSFEKNDQIMMVHILRGYFWKMVFTIKLIVEFENFALLVFFHFWCNIEI